MFRLANYLLKTKTAVSPRHILFSLRLTFAACCIFNSPLQSAQPIAIGSAFRVATFSVDVTPPVGHPLLAGQVPSAIGVADPLFAKGFVLLGAGKPIVFVAVDWCEIRNDAYEAWQTAIAAAVATEPKRVLVSSVHQHDAPLADLAAEAVLREKKLTARIIDRGFHDAIVQRVATAAKNAIASAQPISHIGLGKAEVQSVASNRRYVGSDGRPRHDRMSATRDPSIREHPEGAIDPWSRTVSFWSGDQALVALSSYSVHPMSYYGTSQVSADFLGLARRRRQEQTPTTLQIYASGCSGNTVAGKYNDGNHANREILAGRIERAMQDAWNQTKRIRLTTAAFRTTPLRLEPRETDGYGDAAIASRLTSATPDKAQSLAALGWSWRQRVAVGKPIDVSALDFGVAQVVLLPGESYVEYQLFAQKLRPESFVVALGYGECAPGYIPTEQAWAEKDANLGSWCWVAPGAEVKMKAAIKAVLNSKP